MQLKYFFPTCVKFPAITTQPALKEEQQTFLFFVVRAKQTTSRRWCRLYLFSDTSDGMGRYSGLQSNLHVCRWPFLADAGRNDGASGMQGPFQGACLPKPTVGVLQSKAV